MREFWTASVAVVVIWGFLTGCTDPNDVSKGAAARAGLEVRGLRMGVSSEVATATMQERSMLAVPGKREGGVTSMLSPLPKYAQVQALFEDLPDCREYAAAYGRSNGSSESPACPVIGRLYYGESGGLVALQLKPAAFKIDKISAEQFAQNIVNEYDIPELSPDVKETALGPCTAFRGVARSGELVTVRDCLGLELQVQAQSEAGASYN